MGKRERDRWTADVEAREFGLRGSSSGLWKRRRRIGGRRNAAHVIYLSRQLWIPHQEHLKHLPLFTLAFPLLSLSRSTFVCQQSPPPPLLSLSDLARALSPQERGKSFWQTAASVKEEEIAKREKEENRAKRGNIGTETDRHRREGEGSLCSVLAPSHPGLTFFLTCQMNSHDSSHVIPPNSSTFLSPPSLPQCLILSSSTRLDPSIFGHTHLSLCLSVPLLH